MDKIGELRRRIDVIDREILELLEKRFKIAMEIGRIKRGLGIDIYDPKREREVIEKAGEYARIYMEILRYSRMIQQGEIDLNMDNSIGIVGYGRMGRLFTEIFRRYFRDVIIYDIKRDIKPPKNVIAVDKLEELVKDSDYIMVSTPLTNIHESIASIRRLVIELDLKGKTIFDIATIKYRVIPELSKYPDTVNVASIHPMFGPEIESHIGRKILIMDVPGKEGGADKLINLFSKIGFRTIETDYISHDIYIIYTIGLPYLFGYTYGKTVETLDKDVDMYGGPSYKLYTEYYRKILDDGEEFINYIFMHPSGYEILRKVTNTLWSISGLDKI